MGTFRRFDSVRERLEAQYETAVFSAESGMGREELAAALETHRSEYPDEPRMLTKAWLFELLCRRARIAAEPGDPFIGKLEHHDLLHALRREWWDGERAREFADDPSTDPGAWHAQLDCASHICPNWNTLLTQGVVGIRDAAIAGNSILHQAVATVFGGILTLIARFNALQPHPALAALAERPPDTLHEALQLAYLYHELLELDGEAVRSMGRFDLLYNDFYLRDKAAGRLTREQAKELLKYFWIKFYAKTQGRLFGKPFLFGPDPNEFSRLCFETYREMTIEDPKFHLRLAERTPTEFVEQVVGCILDGCTSIVIVNDDRLVDILRHNGKTQDDARDYILIGCYEPAVQGRELNCSGAAVLNLARAVEQVLTEEACPSFDSLKHTYLEALDTNFTAIAHSVRRWERLWPAISPAPLLSGVTDSCLERGLDISQAGADYNTSGCCCIGLADAVDSLAVIEQLVYRDRHCSLAELRKALAANWEGFEDLRCAARHRVPKWGNDDDRVDRLAVEIANFLGRRINREPNARGGVFQAALFGILPVVQSFGKRTGALPNGRRAGEPLTINTGASVGMNKHGVTSLIGSVTKLDLAQFPNGTVLDVMLHPTTVAGPKGVQIISALLRSHFAQGGLGIQFNVFDADTLRAAQREPEKYTNLQVRVCGWNARFSNLSRAEQDLFIAKAESCP